MVVVSSVRVGSDSISTGILGRTGGLETRPYQTNRNAAHGYVTTTL